MNHFAKVCRGKAVKKEKHPNKDTTRSKRPVHPLKDSRPANESDSDSEGYLYNVRSNKTPVAWVKVCKHIFDATIDTGATLNVIDRQTYEKMDGVHLRKTNVKAFVYTAEKPVKFIGKFEALVETRKRVAVATFHVAEKSDSGNLISANTAQELGLITLHVKNVVSGKKGNLDSILNKHSKVFTSLGKLKNIKSL
mgnify:CR=1 FL=1